MPKAVTKTVTKAPAPTPAPKATPKPKTVTTTKTATVAAPCKPPAPKPAPQPDPEPVEQEIVYDEALVEEPFGEQISAETAEALEATDDLIPTPAVKLPPPIPTAHFAVIEGFERKDFDSGACAAVAKLRFEDNDREDNYTIWLPALFVEDFMSVVADPEGTLPNEPGDKDAGVKGNMQLNQYLRNVASGDRTAVMQKLMAVAAEQGHTRKGLGIDSAPDSIETWFEITNAILVGVRVIALCRKDRNAQDPAFANMLRVQGVIAPSVLEDPKQKVLRAWNGKAGYVFAWEA